MIEHPDAVTITVRGVLIDMDGVLISSTACDEKCWLRWARIHGMEGQFVLKATHGRRTKDTIRALRPDLDAELEQKRMEEIEMEEREGIVILPGARQFLASLPSEKWTIVSSASARVLRARLECAHIHVPLNVVTADSVLHGKPHPEPYQAAARILGLQPQECLVIEDAPSGVESGKAARCNVLAVLSSHPVADLTEADWIVPSLEYVIAAPTQDGAIAVRLTRLSSESHFDENRTGS